MIVMPEQCCVAFTRADRPENKRLVHLMPIPPQMMIELAVSVGQTDTVVRHLLGNTTGDSRLLTECEHSMLPSSDARDCSASSSCPSDRHRVKVECMGITEYQPVQLAKFWKMYNSERHQPPVTLMQEDGVTPMHFVDTGNGSVVEVYVPRTVSSYPLRMLGSSDVLKCLERLPRNINISETKGLVKLFCGSGLKPWQVVDSEIMEWDNVPTNVFWNSAYVYAPGTSAWLPQIHLKYEFAPNFATPSAVAAFLEKSPLARVYPDALGPLADIISILASKVWQVCAFAVQLTGFCLLPVVILVLWVLFDSVFDSYLPDLDPHSNTKQIAPIHVVFGLATHSVTRLQKVDPKILMCGIGICATYIYVVITTWCCNFQYNSARYMRLSDRLCLLLGWTVNACFLLFVVV
jgi:hypothetical protein